MINGHAAVSPVTKPRASMSVKTRLMTDDLTALARMLISNTSLVRSTSAQCFVQSSPQTARIQPSGCRSGSQAQIDLLTSDELGDSAWCSHALPASISHSAGTTNLNIDCLPTDTTSAPPLRLCCFSSHGEPRTRHSASSHLFPSIVDCISTSRRLIFQQHRLLSVPAGRAPVILTYLDTRILCLP